jgi:hypothetical protein
MADNQNLLKFHDFGEKEPKEFSEWVKTFLEGTLEITIPNVGATDIMALAEEVMATGLDAVKPNDVYGYYEKVYDNLDTLIQATAAQHGIYLEDLLENIHFTLVSKNIDYGASFDTVVDKLGLAGAVVRVMDKTNRLKSLVGTTPEVGDESTYDTVLDLIGYLMLTLHYYQDKGDEDVANN